MDVTLRGAVSIGRRLQDPLAELVKLDPKSIGVGQYQHDVDQPALTASLDRVVESVVNKVGVDLNTASPTLLRYIAGLGPALATAIVAFRDEHGAFATRAQLKKVPRLGARAFEQCAGFLRIRGGDEPLDASAVHPERYALVTKMAKDLGVARGALVGDESLGREAGALEVRRREPQASGCPRSGHRARAEEARPRPARGVHRGGLRRRGDRAGPRQAGPGAQRHRHQRRGLRRLRGHRRAPGRAGARQRAVEPLREGSRPRW